LESGNSQGQVNHYRINVRDPTGQPNFVGFRKVKGSRRKQVSCSLYDFQRAIFPLSSQRAKEMEFSKRFLNSLQVIA
jgi:hypothetical protein